MPIASTDIKYHLSGGAANSNPALSIGGAKSSVVRGTDIFDAVSSAEASAGRVEYRLIYISNTHATLTLLGAKLWINLNTPSADTDIAVGLAAAGMSAAETAIANDTTAPAGVSFSAPGSFAAGLLLGDMAPGAYYGVWERRTVNAGAASANDSYTLRAQGDTNP